MNTTRFAILAVSLLLIMSCVREKEERSLNEATYVKVETVEKSKVIFPVFTTGKLSSKTEINLSFKTGGIISSLSVAEGESVESGHLLARLDMTEISAQAEQAKLAYEKSNRDYQRVQNLYKDSVATLENLQDSKTALEVARANMEIAGFNLNYSSIKAPFNGKVLRKLAEENEIVGPGQPVLIFSSTEADWVLKASLSDRDIVNIELGDSALVSFDAIPEKTFHAEVVELGQAADPYTGTYEVELKVNNMGQKMMSGLIGKARIFPSIWIECLNIPVDALFDASGLSGYVFVLQDDTAYKRKIQVSGIAERLCVLSGLSEGEKVIVDGVNYIKSGDKVVVAE